MPIPTERRAVYFVTPDGLVIHIAIVPASTDDTHHAMTVVLDSLDTRTLRDALARASHQPTPNNSKRDGASSPPPASGVYST